MLTGPGGGCWWLLYADALLRAYLPATAGVMTVSPGIADRYAACYEVKPIVVTNSPPAADLAPTPVHAPIRLIHHGGADPQRRLELMIETMDLVDDRFELSLMLVPGDRRYLERLKRLAASQSRVRLVRPPRQRESSRPVTRTTSGSICCRRATRTCDLLCPTSCSSTSKPGLLSSSVPRPRWLRSSAITIAVSSPTRSLRRRLPAPLRQQPDEQISFYKEQADDAAHRLNAETNREAVLRLVRTALAG